MHSSREMAAAARILTMSRLPMMSVINCVIWASSKRSSTFNYIYIYIYIYILYSTGYFQLLDVCNAGRCSTASL